VIFSPEDYAYVRGDKFSNGYKMHMHMTDIEQDRDTYLCNKLKDKRVIHMGFLDHYELFEKKLADNTWLHRKLVNACKVCAGCDLHEHMIHEVQQRLGYNHLYAWDVLHDSVPDEILSENWDTVLVPDVLEHVTDDVLFMKQVKKKLGGITQNIIITVPNAFSFQNFWFTEKGIECINSDHRHWYSVFTLAKCMHDAGIKATWYGFLSHGKNSGTEGIPMHMKDSIIMGGEL